MSVNYYFWQLLQKLQWWSIKNSGITLGQSAQFSRCPLGHFWHKTWQAQMPPKPRSPGCSQEQRHFGWIRMQNWASVPGSIFDTEQDRPHMPPKTSPLPPPQFAKYESVFIELCHWSRKQIFEFGCVQMQIFFHLYFLIPPHTENTSKIFKYMAHASVFLFNIVIFLAVIHDKLHIISFFLFFFLSFIFHIFTWSINTNFASQRKQQQHLQKS